MLFAFLSFAKRGLSKRFLIAWNIAGVLSLLTIVVIAVLSAPLPIQRLAFGQPNVAVLKFPFVFLPDYIVPVVLLTHMLALRKLVREVPPETI